MPAEQSGFSRIASLGWKRGAQSDVDTLSGVLDDKLEVILAGHSLIEEGDKSGCPCNYFTMATGRTAAPSSLPPKQTMEKAASKNERKTSRDCLHTSHILPEGGLHLHRNCLLASK
jgi:hypothetical protein